MKKIVKSLLSILFIISISGCSDTSNNTDSHEEAVHAVVGDKIALKNLTIMCKNKSDAEPAMIALGVANTSVVNDYLDNGCLLFQPKKMNLKVEIMQFEQAPLPNDQYLSLYKVKVIEYNENIVENDPSRWWIADLLNNLK